MGRQAGQGVKSWVKPRCCCLLVLFVFTASAGGAALPATIRPVLQQSAAMVTRHTSAVLPLRNVREEYWEWFNQGGQSMKSWGGGQNMLEILGGVQITGVHNKYCGVPIGTVVCWVWGGGGEVVVLVRVRGHW